MRDGKCGPVLRLANGRRVVAFFRLIVGCSSKIWITSVDPRLVQYGCVPDLLMRRSRNVESSMKGKM